MGLDNILDTPIVESCEFHNQVQTSENFVVEHMSYLQDEIEYEKTDPDYGPTISNQKESDVNSDNDPEVLVVTANNTPVRTTRDTTLQSLENIIVLDNIQDMPVEESFEFRHQLPRPEHFEKEHMSDFEDENLENRTDPDYQNESDASSDNDPEAVVVSDNNTLNKTTRTSRGRKRKFEMQTNVTAKKLRNSNKEYYNYKGKLVKQKCFQDFQRDNTDAEFLSPEMTLIKMYDLYVENLIGEERNNEIREWREGNEKNKNDILKDIDAKDTCNTCDSFAARIQSATGSAKNVLEEAHNKHIDLWREARNLMNHDKLEAHKVKEFEC
ncbi:unnamed protein product [Ceutorhynchus assimilis]|uniref:Uncharacterized protein n=1 Tax=Ceutorhynchus assimilis TaxID=467358 RepID=A0A9N9MID1_9CUCU|nr:unnamed protein product [Ceutorhynchus assimilis]